MIAVNCMPFPWRLSIFDWKVIKFNELKFSVLSSMKISVPNPDKYHRASIMQLQIFLPFSYVSPVATRCTAKWKCSEKMLYKWKLINNSFARAGDVRLWNASNGSSKSSPKRRTQWTFFSIFLGFESNWNSKFSKYMLVFLWSCIASYLAWSDVTKPKLNPRQTTTY